VRRGIIDTLRRGGENAIANWQLSAIRFAEVIVFAMISIAAVIASLVPILLSVGIRLADVHTPEELESAMMTLLERWMLLVWIALGFCVLLALFLFIHSFVEAGCARVFVDADRAAGPAVLGPRQRYRSFSAERWMAGAKEGWWKVFWIYNLAWGAASIVLLIPLLPIAVLLIVFRESPAAMATAGCAGMLLFLLFAIVVAMVTGMWVNRAIVNWAAQRTTARASLGTAWRALKSDLGRHLLAALAIIVVALAGSTVFASFSMFAAFGGAMGHNATFSLVTLPIRLVGSLLSSAFSALIGSWYIAAYAALAVENKS
jgi:hypothetical protein